MESIAPNVIYKPKINNRDPGRLGRADLLSSSDKEVFVACACSVVAPEATAMLFLTRKGEMLDPEKPLAEYPIVGETDLLTFRVPGKKIAGESIPGSSAFTGDGNYDAVVRLVYSPDTFHESPPTEVTVKCSVPGGTAKDDGSTADINENLSPPEVVPNPVPDGYGKPVQLKLNRYDVCNAGDQVLFEWGGEKIAFPITNPSEPITAEVPWAAVVEIGGGDVPLTWSVTDVVSNWSRYAPSIRVPVEIDKGTLPTPELRYDLTTPVIDPLDLTRLKGQPFLMHLIGSDGVTPGDVVTAHWKATLTDGSPREHGLPPATWTQPYEPLNLDVPYGYAEEAAGGTVAIWYTLNGGAKLSKTRRYRVTDLPEALLPPPIISGRDGDELDPFAQGKFIHITARHAPLYMLLGATVTMTIIGSAGAANLYWTDDFTLTSGDLNKDIPFDCPAASLQAVEGGTARFHYEITPRPSLVAMHPGGIHAATKISETVELKIRRAGAQPNYPAPTDVNVIDGVLDPDLPSTIVTIPLPAQGGPAVGTYVTLNWIGQPAYSSSDTVVNGRALSFRVGIAHINGSRGTTVNATYRDAAGRLSDALSFRVGASASLPAPTVDEAQDDTLDPIAAKDGITVRVTAALTIGTPVVVHFGNWTSQPTAWLPDLGITVPASDVAASLGTSVPISYTVDGTTRSDTLVLRVLDFSDGDARLPAPIIPLADGDVLDLTKHSGQILTTTRPWPLISAGQKVWLEIHASDTPSPLVLWEKSGVTSSEVRDGLSKAITRSWLDARTVGSTITPMLWVTFDKSLEKTHAVRLPSVTYTLKNADHSDETGVAYEMETFDWAFGTAYEGRDFRLFTATIFSAGTISYHDLSALPFIEGGQLMVVGSVRLVLRRPALALHFGVRNPGPSTVTVVLYDENDQPLYSEVLAIGNRWFNYALDPKQAQRIGNITFLGSVGSVFLDNIRFKTGAEWNERSLPFIDDFETYEPGNLGKQSTLGNRWETLTTGIDLSIEEPDVYPSGKVLAARSKIDHSTTPHLVELSPRMALAPKNRIALKLRLLESPDQTLELAVTYINTETLVQRCIKATATIGRPWTAVTLTDPEFLARANEAIACITICLPYSDNTLYFGSIEIE